MYLFAAGLLLVITITGVLSYGRAFWSAMNGSERNGNSTRPNKGPKGPIMVRFLEAALIVAFFVIHSYKPDVGVWPCIALNALRQLSGSMAEIRGQGSSAGSVKTDMKQWHHLINLKQQRGD